MNTAEKIIYYTQTKWCIPFRDLHHSVCEVCELVKPICPEIEPNKYLEHFLKNIDFDNIDKSPTKEEGLKNCKVLYFGLDQLLKNDIDKGISEFQMNLSGRRTFELIRIQNTLIDLCGLLERQSRTSKPGISFAQRFINLYQSAERKDRLFPIDYQILIKEFNETILNDLLSSYKILNDTINVKFPLPVETKIALHKASQKVNEFRKKYNSEIESLKPFLLSKGLILPKDHDEFLFWLLDEKYKQESFFPLPKIEDKDFFEYSRFREKQLDNMGIQESKKTNVTNQKVQPLIKAPIIAFFCQLVNESTLLPKGEAETNQVYCMRICKEFNLIYTDRVRQGFSKNKNVANSRKVKELILPSIDAKASKAITEYLDNKQPPKQNLYA